MQALALQPNIEIEPLDLYVPESGAFLILTAPCDEAARYIFEYLTAWRDLELEEGRRLGTVGKKEKDPKVVWIRAQRRSRWFREYLWSAGQVVKLIDEVWVEVGSKWISVPEPMAPASPMPMIAPAPVTPSGIRGLIQMAGEMKLPAPELERRLEAQTFAYVVTKMIECRGIEEGANNWYRIKREYFFDKRDADHNIANRDVEGKLRIRKQEVSG